MMRWVFLALATLGMLAFVESGMRSAPAVHPNNTITVTSHAYIDPGAPPPPPDCCQGG